MPRPMVAEQSSAMIEGLSGYRQPDRWEQVSADFQVAFNAASAINGQGDRHFLKNVRAALHQRVQEGEGAAYMAVAMVRMIPFKEVSSSSVGKMLANLIRVDGVPAATVDRAVEHLAASFCTRDEVEGIIQGGAGTLCDPNAPRQQDPGYDLGPAGKAFPDATALNEALFAAVKPSEDDEDYDPDDSDQHEELMGMALARGHALGHAASELAAVMMCSIYKDEITAERMSGAAEGAGMPSEAVTEMARFARGFLAHERHGGEYAVASLDEFLDDRPGSSLASGPRP